MMLQNYIYIFVRLDLSISQRAVQSAHAAIEAARSIPPQAEHPHLVLIGLKNEKKLKEIQIELDKQDIQTYTFNESDRNNEMTSFATELISEEKKYIFRRFMLL